MNKKTLKVISLFLCLFLMFSICGCKDKPTEEEIYYEYEYEGGSSMNNVGNESIESKNPNSPLSSENSSAAQGQADTSSVGQVPTNTTLPFTFEEYLHKSITISIYDSSCTTYGFAWNSIGKPIKPVLKISKGSTFNESNCKEYAVNVEMCETYISETDTTYYYVSKEQFYDLQTNDSLVEYTLYDGEYYGTFYSEIERHPDDVPLLLVIDGCGRRSLMMRYPMAKTIFIAPPSLEELKARLIVRGENSDEEIERRLTVAKDELEQAYKYDFTVVNEEVESCAKEIAKIISKTVLVAQ